MRQSISRSFLATALLALLASACYVTTTTDPQQTTPTPAPPPRTAPAPDPQPAPVTDTRPAPPPRVEPTPAPPPRVEPAPANPPPVQVNDHRRRRLGRAAVFEIEPTAGPAGTVVNVYGNFRPFGLRQSGAVSCAFTGAKPVSPFYVSVGRMILVVPKDATSGPVSCSVGNKALWAGRFAVTSQLPDIFVPTTEEQGLLGAVYRLPPNTTKLPDFASLGEPVATFVMPALQVAPRRFDVGFPRITADGEPLLEWFAIRFVGQIEATKTAEYTFQIKSDDGSRLYIDGQRVIDNDGIHGPTPREGKINLTEGKHEIVVEYFQGPRYEIALELWWKRGNNPFSAVPAKSLSRYTTEFDCSEPPAVACCRAMTPECTQCAERSRRLTASWEAQCKR